MVLAHAEGMKRSATSTPRPNMISASTSTLTSRIAWARLLLPLAGAACTSVAVHTALSAAAAAAAAALTAEQRWRRAVPATTVADAPPPTFCLGNSMSTHTAAAAAEDEAALGTMVTLSCSDTLSVSGAANVNVALAESHVPVTAAPSTVAVAVVVVAETWRREDEDDNDDDDDDGGGGDTRLCTVSDATVSVPYAAVSVAVVVSPRKAVFCVYSPHLACTHIHTRCMQQSKHTLRPVLNYFVPSCGKS